jgi:ribosomal protein S12 methylthiotransferase
VQTVGFDHVGVFTYSHEEGTTAHGLADDVPDRVKQRRRSEVMRLQKGLVRKAQQLRVGQRVRLLVDGPSSEHGLVLRARLEGQAPDIDPVVYLTDCDPSDFSAGQFIQADIVASREYDLLAAPAKVASPAARQAVEWQPARRRRATPV